MKTLFILFFFWASSSALAVPVQAPAQKRMVCSFESGEVGKITYRGINRDDAVEKTSRACLRARVALFQKARGHRPSVERKILFAESCVNNTFCRR